MHEVLLMVFFVFNASAMTILYNLETYAPTFQYVSAHQYNDSTIHQVVGGKADWVDKDQRNATKGNEPISNLHDTLVFENSTTIQNVSEDLNTTTTGVDLETLKVPGETLIERIDTLIFPELLYSKTNESRFGSVSQNETRNDLSDSKNVTEIKIAQRVDQTITKCQKVQEKDRPEPDNISKPDLVEDFQMPTSNDVSENTQQNLPTRTRAKHRNALVQTGSSENVVYVTPTPLEENDYKNDSCQCPCKGCRVEQLKTSSATTLIVDNADKQPKPSLAKPAQVHSKPVMETGFMPIVGTHPPKGVKTTPGLAHYSTQPQNNPKFFNRQHFYNEVPQYTQTRPVAISGGRYQQDTRNNNRLKGGNFLNYVTYVTYIDDR